jgi:hypothetical protein
MSDELRMLSVYLTPTQYDLCHLQAAQRGMTGWDYLSYLCGREILNDAQRVVRVDRHVLNIDGDD